MYGVNNVRVFNRVSLRRISFLRHSNSSAAAWRMRFRLYSWL